MSQGENKPSLLLVIAHPDDEAMFFGPSLLVLARDYRLHVLCLSPGGVGAVATARTRELRASCAVLGVAADCVRVVDLPSLRDGLDTDWPADVIAAQVLDQATACRADRLLTFDAHGVSGHRNHRAAHAGVLAALRSSRAPRQMQAFELESVPLARKYAGPLDWPLSGLSPHVAFVSIAGFWQLQRALSCHRSQLVWFRQLYRVFSRYMFVNTLSRIDL
jgi:N-acetylglucosaminylphosphatidylinositol deacetylase